MIYGPELESRIVRLERLLGHYLDRRIRNLEAGAGQARQAARFLRAAPYADGTGGKSCTTCNLPDTLFLTDTWGTVALQWFEAGVPGLIGLPGWYGCHMGEFPASYFDGVSWYTNTCGGVPYGGTIDAAVYYYLPCPSINDDGTVTAVLRATVPTCTGTGGARCVKPGTCDDLSWFGLTNRQDWSGGGTPLTSASCSPFSASGTIGIPYIGCANVFAPALSVPITITP